MNMESFKTMLKSEKSKNYAYLFLAYLAISLVMFWPVTLNITTHVVNGAGDVMQTMFNLWFVPYSLFVLHTSPYFTNLLFFPVGASLVTHTLSPLAGIVSLPFQFISMAFAYNVIYFLSFALAGLFMYMLADYITKNKAASFIAGLIFAFSPMHIAQAYSHLDWTIIEFLPLFTLYYIRSLREKDLKLNAIAAVAFVFASFMGDLQQGLIIAIFGVVLTALVVYLERKELQMKEVAKSIGFTVLFGIIIGSPFLAAILPSLNAATLSSAQANSAVYQNMLWSDNLMSFFLPSYYNGIFHEFSLSYFDKLYGLTYQGYTFTPDIAEKTSYIGYSVLALVAIAFYADYKKTRLKNTLAWGAILLVFMILALGPYLQVLGNVTTIELPFMLYRNVPILNIVREPGRFDLIVTMVLGILAAIGYKELRESKYWDKKYFFVFIALILIEYNGMALSSSFASTLIKGTTIPSAYYSMGNLTGNFSVLILPALPNNGNAPALWPGTEDYYVTALHKPIVGGYTSRNNATQLQAIQAIPLATSASYLEQGMGLISPSPFAMNVTNSTLVWLLNYNVSFVAVIRNAYNVTAQSQLYNYLYGVFGAPAYVDNSTFVFPTAGAFQRAYSSKALVSVSSRNLQYGLAICQSQLTCNQTFASMWWGYNLSDVVVYSPRAANATMHMQAMANANSKLQIYPNQLTNYTEISLNSSVQNFTYPLKLVQGLNFVFFYPSAPQTYSYYGIRNVTFNYTT